jgi:hypothetical protein
MINIGLVGYGRTGKVVADEIYRQDDALLTCIFKKTRDRFIGKDIGELHGQNPNGHFPVGERHGSGFVPCVEEPVHEQAAQVRADIRWEIVTSGIGEKNLCRRRKLLVAFPVNHEQGKSGKHPEGV